MSIDQHENNGQRVFKSEIFVTVNADDAESSENDATLNRASYLKLHKLPDQSKCRLSSASLSRFRNNDWYRNQVEQGKILRGLESKIKAPATVQKTETTPQIIHRAESTDSITKINKELSYFIMDNKKKDKKRSSSFRNFFSVSFFGKDKKKDKTKQQTNNDYVDNYQNETNSNTSNFIRNSTHRHTLGCEHSINRRNTTVVKCDDQIEDPPPEIMQKYALNHVDRFNKIRSSFDEKLTDDRTRHNMINRNTYVNALVAQAEFRNTSRGDTPPRAQDTHRPPVIVKPKARLPPPPIQPQLDDTYGTVFDAIPKSPTLEMSKLKLSPNREILQPQPRLKSPIPAAKVSTDKMIATEILRNATLDTRNQPPLAESTPETKPPRNDETTSSVAISSSRSSLVVSPVPKILEDMERRSTASFSSADVELRRRDPTRRLGSPSKGEIRRSVEAYYWKEIKKIKEQEDYEIYMSQFHFATWEDPTFTGRGRQMNRNDPDRSRRSSSVPRQPTTYHQRPPERIYGQKSDYDTYKPIFRRGSLSGSLPPPAPSYKKVSFHNAQQQVNWPTKNGFTKSPPQRRLLMERQLLAENYHQQQQQQYQPQFRPIYETAQPPPTENLYAGYRTMSRQDMENLRNARRNESTVENPYGYTMRRENYLPPPPNPYNDIYSTRQTYYHPDSTIYNNQHPDQPLYAAGGRRVTIRNKVCDIYGRIHDMDNVNGEIRSDGVLIGQLREAPPQSPPSNFRRGGRLTSSSNDILSPNRRFVENGYARGNLNPVRPLPPLPDIPKKNGTNKKKKK